MGHLWILGLFSIALGVHDFLAPFWITTKLQFLVYGVLFAVLNAAPISLTTSCYGDVVPLHLFAEAISITCIFECIGVFTMPNVAGRLADVTHSMASPVHIAGVLIAIGGVLQCVAGYAKGRNVEEKKTAVLQLTKAPKEKTVTSVT